MKLAYIGAGYVGACSAAVSADSGHEVLVYDIDSDKIKKFSSFNRRAVESCLFEDGLVDILQRNKNRLYFTDNIAEVGEYLDKAEAVFMCLPTPEKDETGETNMEYYRGAVGDLAKVLVKRNNGRQTNYILVVNKSTVPINTSEETKLVLAAAGVKNFGVGSNPEFLVEGKAIAGSIRPERVVVGARNEQDRLIFRNVYKRFFDSPKTEYIEVNPREAETGKLLANFTLFKKLAACFDVVGRVCEHFEGLHFENVRKILISDKRIGEWGFYNSLFAGGSCFIKDSRSLSYQLKQKGARTHIIDNVLAANERQLENFLFRPEKDLSHNWRGKKVGLLGLAFKRDTNDIRNSPAIKITNFLLERQVDFIKAYDPVAGGNYMGRFKNHPRAKRISLVDSEAEAMRGADVIIVVTDWPQFRELEDLIKKFFPRGGLIMDGRRMLKNKYRELREAGYIIVAVGSPTIK